MIAADTSALSDYLRNKDGPDMDRLDEALRSGSLALPPVVVTELLSDPKASSAIQRLLDEIQKLEVLEGYWVRAGENRRKLKQRGLKALVADSLIAQSCIDHDVELITRDGDFRHFSKHCGLKLA